MVIGIDFDGTINSMLEKWLEWLNRAHDRHVQYEHVTEWEVWKQYPDLQEESIFEPLNTPEFWDEVEIKQDAAEVIRQLIKERHRILIITSTHHRLLHEKMKRCLFKHLPFLKKEDVIVTYDKSLVRCDLLLDDGEHNFKNFIGTRVIFDAPYNRDATLVDYRVGSWKEFYVLIRGLDRKGIYPPMQRVQQFKADRGCGKTAWLHQRIFDSHEVPCYVIIPENKYRHFCESYMERFGERCPAKLFRREDYKADYHNTDARFFVDMPSTFDFGSELFEVFLEKILYRPNIIFVADFKNTSWNIV